MAKLIAMYKAPTDKAAFDRYYFDTHVPIAKKIPGLRKYDVSQGGIGAADGSDTYHLVATLYFDSMADIQSALGSPEGQAAAGDIPNFADNGVDLIFFDTKDV